jgi:hypothetical protein
VVATSKILCPGGSLRSYTPIELAGYPGIPKQYKKRNDTEIIVSFVASVSQQHQAYKFGHIHWWGE